MFRQAAALARHRNHTLSAAPLLRLLEETLGCGASFEELQVPFYAVATGSESWDVYGPLLITLAFVVGCVLLAPLTLRRRTP